MLLVPCLQFLELRVLGERGHGVSGWEQGPRREPRRKRGERRTTGGEPRSAASFMAQAPGPAPPLAPPRPVPPSAPRGQPSPQPRIRDLSSSLLANWQPLGLLLLCQPLPGIDWGTEAELLPASLVHSFIHSFT